MSRIKTPYGVAVVHNIKAINKFAVLKIETSSRVRDRVCRFINGTRYFRLLLRDGKLQPWYCDRCGLATRDHPSRTCTSAQGNSSHSYTLSPPVFVSLVLCIDRAENAFNAPPHPRPTPQLLIQFKFLVYFLHRINFITFLVYNRIFSLF